MGWNYYKTLPVKTVLTNNILLILNKKEFSFYNKYIFIYILNLFNSFKLELSNGGNLKSLVFSPFISRLINLNLISR